MNGKIEPQTQRTGYPYHDAWGTPLMVQGPSSTICTYYKKIFLNNIGGYGMTDEDFDLADFRIVDTRPNILPKGSIRYKRPRRREPVRPFVVATPLEWESKA